MAGTGTSVVALLMVFLTQHTQNRDAVAMHLKLNELGITLRVAAACRAAFDPDPWTTNHG